MLGRKNSMTGPRQLQTCSHQIYIQTLTGVYQLQAARYFLFAFLMHLYNISIGTLESDSLSLSISSRIIKWLHLVLFLWPLLKCTISNFFYICLLQAIFGELLNIMACYITVRNGAIIIISMTECTCIPQKLTPKCWFVILHSF